MTNPDIYFRVPGKLRNRKLQSDMCDVGHDLDLAQCCTVSLNGRTAWL
jgi:hypothetical protein